MIAWEDWYEVNQLQGLPWCFGARREYSEYSEIARLRDCESIRVSVCRETSRALKPSVPGRV